LIIFFLVSCSFGDREEEKKKPYESCPPSCPGSNDIAGLYDASWNTYVFSSGKRLLDIKYEAITRAGEITYYNYLGDEYDKEFSDWGDCYMVQRKRTPTVTHISGYTFIYRYPVESFSFEGELLDKTYNVTKGAKKMANVEVTGHVEVKGTAYVKSDGRLVLDFLPWGVYSNWKRKTNKTIDELEKYTRCPYSD